MKDTSKTWILGVAALLAVPPLSAVEIITRDDIVNNVVKKDQLVKVADNAIFLLDASSSTNDPFEGTNERAIQVVKKELTRRNSYFPEIGHNIGVYRYTDWSELSPVQPYDRDAVAAALATLPDRGSGPTPLKAALEKLDGVLEPLTGRTAVFVFWDGEYTGKNPAETARELAGKHDVCFYVVSSADEERMATLTEDVATLNACSRVIPLADFINRPEYTSGALFDVKVTEEVTTTTDTKVVGLKVDDINFATNKTELSAEDRADLDKVAAFMKERPGSYAKIAGYTDNVGTRDHNEGLSRARARMVASYLKAQGIDDSRMMLFWYGPENPIVANDNPANQARNRRVELAVGLDG